MAIDNKFQKGKVIVGKSNFEFAFSSDILQKNPMRLTNEKGIAQFNGTKVTDGNTTYEVAGIKNGMTYLHSKNSEIPSMRVKCSYTNLLDTIQNKCGYNKAVISTDFEKAIE